ncbi:MAG: hypothetical protein JJ884_07690 [Maricaulis sp.]|uniref:hypothetical protein n=1 Tax=Maricaulis sp. TaxID=1486257 RepID=UPI001B156FCD|nr:hypothetical protein [Maricaulis sp.]MBO6730263.1 hypothetical protein [Maricaulis sp.]MBO6847387.1 hypothetical protein [Maricaulis sp.]MBO6876413.1 hypothetical protein [Maricaulis sp.]
MRINQVEGFAMFRVLLIYLLLAAGLLVWPASDDDTDKPTTGSPALTYCPVVQAPDLAGKQSISNRMFRLR